MKKKISYNEYRRRVFNECMLECFRRIEESCCEIEKNDTFHLDMAKRMSDKFYTDLLQLDTSTVDSTKKKLSESVTFIKDCINISEAVADEKTALAIENKMDMDDDQRVELSPEDEALVDKLFDEKAPTLQIDSIRDATVHSLLAEDKKSQEIKDALDIAQSQVAAGDNTAAMEETVNRLNHRGPTSLMNAILNNVSEAAVKDVNANSKTPVSVGKVMSENAQEIRNRAVMMYSLFEASSVFGVKRYSNKEVELLAHQIYYGK